MFKGKNTIKCIGNLPKEASLGLVMFMRVILTSAYFKGPSIATQLQAQHRTIPVNLATSGALLGNASVIPAPNYVNSCPDSPLEGAFGLKCGEEASSTGVAAEPIVTGENILSLNFEPPPVVSNPALSDKIKKEGTATSVVAAADESDDYRSECENCNMRQTPGYEEDLVTMTLHRRTGDSGDQHFYSNRTSLTLPTHPRKQQQRCSNGLQSGVAISCARENWFSSMPESYSSDEEEEEE